MDPNDRGGPLSGTPLRRRTTKLIRVTSDGRVISAGPVARVEPDTLDTIPRFHEKYRRDGGEAMNETPCDCPKCGRPAWSFEREVVRRDGRKHPGPRVTIGPCGCEVLADAVPENFMGVPR